MKLMLIGGFLGSGKTTAIRNACKELLKNDVKASVVTNDQGNDLVDTAYIKSSGIAVKEVTGGCFCCNYDKLAQSISDLYEKNQPEVIFAESVGSCTDLVATVAKPMMKYNPEFTVVISVFADATVLLSIISGTSLFLSDEVRYIYKKQLEEADIIILNKADVLSKDELRMLNEVIKNDYPGKIIIEQNSLDQRDIQQWLVAMNQFKSMKSRKSLDIDYDLYGAGEAMLAWLDEELEIYTNNNSAYEVAMELIGKIESDIRKQNYLIGHLKFLVTDGTNTRKLSYTAVRHSETDQSTEYPETNKISLLINARVQTEPGVLKNIISSAIEETAHQSGSKIVVNKLSCFQPGYPKPTHRILN
jgi:G3E family GTPase